VLFFVKWAV